MMKERQSNFELLRIIAMSMIVAGHFLGQGGGYQGDLMFNQIMASVMGSASRISVNLFLMIGTWFMVDYDFKAERVLKLYGELWLYTALFTLISYLLGEQLSVKILVGGILVPFISMSLWYVTVYIALLMLSPFLKKFFYWEKTAQERLLVLSSFLICGMSTVQSLVDNYLCGLVWFIYIYMFIGYFKHYMYNKVYWNKNISLIMGIMLYLFMVVGKYICNQLGDVFIVFQFIEKRIGQYLIDYKSLPNFCCSLLIFFYFSKLDIGSKKWINILAKSALAVYIIHQVPAFYNFLWKNIYRCDIWNSSDFFMLGIFGVIITVYIGAIVIDGLRRKFIEPKWVKSSLFKNISCKLEKFYDI